MGGWACPTCLDEMLRERVQNSARGRTRSGIHLPSGVTDPAKANPSFKDVVPNRAARRALARRT
jgi:hypothetical protein